jgi:hypothetical protein
MLAKGVLLLVSRRNRREIRLLGTDLNQVRFGDRFHICDLLSHEDVGLFH